MTQQSFLSDPAWEKGDKLTLNGRQVEFRLYNRDGSKFQVRWVDMHDGGTIDRWYPIDQLPKKEPDAPAELPPPPGETTNIVQGKAI